MTIVDTNAYPRNAGMASGFYQALKAIRLPSGATVYFESGEWESKMSSPSRPSDLDAEAAAASARSARYRPTSAPATTCSKSTDTSRSERRGWILEELFDHEAEWIQQDDLDDGKQRRAELQRAIDEAAEEDESDAEQLDHAQEALEQPHPGSCSSKDSQLDAIAALPTPRARPQPRLATGSTPGRGRPQRCSSTRRLPRTPAHRRRIPTSAIAVGLRIRPFDSMTTRAARGPARDVTTCGIGLMLSRPIGW